MFFLLTTTLTMLMMTTGTMVKAKPMPIHHRAEGCITVARKSLPASSPKQAKYIDKPSERIMRLALVVV